MSALIRAELLKLRTTRVFWIYMASTLAFVPLSVALAISGGPKDLSLATSDNIRNVIAAASAGGLVMLLLGISMTAGEFRHNTATTTFLITPDRRRVLAAKFAAGALVATTLAGIVGIAVGAALQVQTLAITLVVLWTGVVESLLVGLVPEVGR